MGFRGFGVSGFRGFGVWVFRGLGVQRLGSKSLDGVGNKMSSSDGFGQETSSFFFFFFSPDGVEVWLASEMQKLQNAKARSWQSLTVACRKWEGQ